MTAALTKAKVISVADDTYKTVTFTDPSLAEKWGTLNEWIQRDYAFLIWRQKLDSLAQAWSPTDFDESALLRGKSLDEARRWINDRVEELNQIERSYVDASVEQGLKQKQTDENERMKWQEIALERDRLELERRAVDTSAKTKNDASKKQIGKKVFGWFLVMFLLAGGGMFTLRLYETSRAAEVSMRANQQQMMITIQHLNEQLAEINGKKQPIPQVSKGGTQDAGVTGETPSVKRPDLRGSPTFKVSPPVEGQPLKLNASVANVGTEGADRVVAYYVIDIFDGMGNAETFLTNLEERLHTKVTIGNGESPVQVPPHRKLVVKALSEGALSKDQVQMLENGKYKIYFMGYLVYNGYGNNPEGNNYQAFYCAHSSGSVGEFARCGFPEPWNQIVSKSQK
jgi:hypothetical protein